MEYINLNGFKIPQIGFGTFPMIGGTLRGALKSAIESGYTLIDTAFKYHNEAEIGEFLKMNHHDNILVESKFSVTQLTRKRFLCFTYGCKTIEDGIEGSLERLLKNTIDIYLLHSPFQGFSKLWRDMIKFRESGLAKLVGVCRFDDNQLNEIKDRYGEYPAINQIEVHPFHSNRDLIEFCKERDIIVEARTILTHGDALGALLASPVLQRIAAEYNKSIPQIIIRWIVQQGLVAIVKSETPSHISENIDVFDFSLTDNQMEAIFSMNKDLSYGCKSSNLVNI